MHTYFPCTPHANPETHEETVAFSAAPAAVYQRPCPTALPPAAVSGLIRGGAAEPGVRRQQDLRRCPAQGAPGGHYAGLRASKKSAQLPASGLRRHLLFAPHGCYYAVPKQHSRRPARPHRHALDGAGPPRRCRGAIFVLGAAAAPVYRAWGAFSGGVLLGLLLHHAGLAGKLATTTYPAHSRQFRLSDRAVWVYTQWQPHLLPYPLRSRHFSPLW